MISKIGFCKDFKGDRPCKNYWIDRNHNCFDPDSPLYSEYSHRILLIKLDAFGDVVRSTCLAEGIKKKYPDSQLSWITKRESIIFIKNNPYIDRKLPYNEEVVRQLQCEKFDIIINLDKDAKATSMMMLFNSEDRRGYGLQSCGFPIPLNEGSEYHYNICLDNWGAKVENTKTYSEMIFEISELEYDNEKPIVVLDKNNFKEVFFKENNISPTNNVILLNTGCGGVYPHKKWTYSGYRDLIKYLLENKNNKIVLAGSKSEMDRNSSLMNEFNSFNLIDTTDKYSLEEFCFLVDASSLVVTGDTLALHLAISLRKNIIVFYGPTQHQETNLFGLGKKFVRKELDCLSCHDQFPCPYEDSNHDGKCMNLISAEEVFSKIKKILY